MNDRLARLADLVRLVGQGGPAVCNVAVTNVCNATCDFCNFAYDKGFVTHRLYLDATRFGDCVDILHRRGEATVAEIMGDNIPRGAVILDYPFSVETRGELIAVMLSAYLRASESQQRQQAL